jgi:predicted MFS family arabinose efflux permease
MNKIVVLISGFFMMLVLGAVYAYSVFRLSLEEVFNISTTISGIPYMVSLFFYALFVMLTGSYLRKYKVRYIATIGTLFVMIGWILSSFAPNIIVFTLSYGVLIGTGVGIMYGIPLYLVSLYFPKRTGLYTGLVLLGFGLSPLFSGPLGEYLIETVGLFDTFLYLGIVFGVVLFVLIYFSKEKEGTVKIIKKTETTLFQDQRFYVVYVLYALGTMVGLMMIGLTYQVGVNVYHFSASEASVFLGLFAIMNGLGRPLFGYITDIKKFVFSALLVNMLVFIFATLGLLIEASFMYVVIFSIFWMSLGAWLSIAPTVTKMYFGQEDYTSNYGIIFTAYGVGAILGTTLSGLLFDFFDGVKGVYVLVILVSVISVLVIISQRKKLSKIDSL